MGLWLVFTGLVINAVSWPLILRMVPMNRFYGIRMAASFESKERWYAINAYGGKQMAGWAWVTILWGLAGQWVPESVRMSYVMFSPLAVLLPLGIGIVLTVIRAQKGLIPTAGASSR